MACGCAGGGGSKPKQVSFNQNGNTKSMVPPIAPKNNKIVSGTSNIAPVFGTALPTPQLGTEQDRKRIQKLRQLAIRQTFNRG
jgi:hypothetical protein